MDFLLSFHEPERGDHDKPTEPFTFKDVRAKRSTLIKFLMLSVDNETWTFLQILAICLRYFITTYVIAFQKSEPGFTGTDCVNTVLDLFYVIDMVSAVLYRYLILVFSPVGFRWTLNLLRRRI